MAEVTTHGEATTAHSHDSFAVDLENDYVPPLQDPNLLAVSSGETGIRRRASEVNRSRPQLSFPTPDIELTPIEPSPLAKVDAIQEDRDETPVEVNKQDVTVDIERASSTAVFPSTTVSQAPSTREHGSTTNLNVTHGSQTKVQKRWARAYYAVLCYNFFLAGWNDGSTGPLLPTIQRSHHVRFFLSHLPSPSCLFHCYGNSHSIYLAL